MPIVIAETLKEWRYDARELLVSETGPADVTFRDSRQQLGLFDDSNSTTNPRNSGRPSMNHRVSKDFLDLARKVACHRDADRWERLYRTLWRLTHGEPYLLQRTIDDDVNRLNIMEKAVRRDVHKIEDFVRFRRVETEGAEHFIAWQRPGHRILRLVAPFFSRRFPTMRWSLLTPNESVNWDLKSLHYGPGVPASEAPQVDALEELWRFTTVTSSIRPAACVQHCHPRRDSQRLNNERRSIGLRERVVKFDQPTQPNRTRQTLTTRSQPPRHRDQNSHSDSQKCDACSCHEVLFDCESSGTTGRPNPFCETMGSLSGTYHLSSTVAITNASVR